MVSSHLSALCFVHVWSEPARRYSIFAGEIARWRFSAPPCLESIFKAASLSVRPMKTVAAPPHDDNISTLPHRFLAFRLHGWPIAYPRGGGNRPFAEEIDIVVTLMTIEDGHLVFSSRR